MTISHEDRAGVEQVLVRSGGGGAGSELTEKEVRGRGELREVAAGNWSNKRGVRSTGICESFS